MPETTRFESKYDPDSGNQYIELGAPLYKVGTKVLYATPYNYQAKIKLKIQDKFWANQIHLGTIVGATFNPDAGATNEKVQWRYVVRNSSPTPSNTSPDTMVKESDICMVIPE